VVDLPLYEEMEIQNLPAKFTTKALSLSYKVGLQGHHQWYITSISYSLVTHASYHSYNKRLKLFTVL